MGGLLHLCIVTGIFRLDNTLDGGEDVGADYFSLKPFGFPGFPLSVCDAIFGMSPLLETLDVLESGTCEYSFDLSVTELTDIVSF